MVNDSVEVQASHDSRRSRRNAWIALAIVILVGLGAWWLTSSRGKNGLSRGRPSATVGTAKATLADMPVTLNEIGTVQPLTTATVRAQEAGVIFSINFTEGQMVSKGQLLATIDPRPYRAALAQAQANLVRDEAQLNVARLDLTRYQTLLKQNSIASQQVDTQAGLVKQLAGTTGADRAAIDTARINLQYTSIVAPISGRIGLRQVDLGNYVTPGDTNGLAIITVTQPIDVSFSLPQENIPAIQGRQASHQSIPVTARDQAGTQVLDQGSFLTLDNQVDPTTGTVKGKARFPNASGKLFPSQFVNVELLADTLHQVVTVPVSAVRHGPKGDFVFELMPDRTVKMRPVKTGPANATTIAILSGLKAGVTVVSEGADGLDDGSKVSLAGDRKPGSGGGGGAEGRHGRHRQQ